MTIDKGHAQSEFLRHTNKRVIDRSIAMGVQLAHNFTGYAGTLNVTTVVTQTHFAHLIDDASLNGF